MGKLTLVRKPDRELPAELAQKALGTLRSADLTQFAHELDVARDMYQKHRDLVEAPEFPEYLLRAMEEDNDKPDYQIHDEFMHPGYDKSVREKAIERARKWEREMRSAQQEVRAHA